MTQPLDDVMDELRETVRRELRMGFTPADEIVEVAVEVMDDGERLRPAAEHLVRVESEALRREQAAWPAETDCDRLDRAFNALEARGIVARQHFSCCQNCGSTEIWAEIDDALADGSDVRGYTFYHAQDTEGAAEGAGVYLAYGAMEEDGIVDVGREIVDVLHAHGLRTDWDGTAAKRICVPLDWKRRREDL